MRRMLGCVALVLTAWIAVGEEAGNAGVPPYRYNVRDTGAAGDGTTDDTAAFRAAFEQARAAGGGTVFAPRGNYRIADRLDVPDEVTLAGVWEVPTAWTQFKGTTLLAEAGRGSEDGPAFITLGRNSVLKGITVFYPEQDKNEIVPYPWCVACRGGDNPSIVDVLLVNPYKGVDFATRNSGRHYIRNLYGQPLRIGLQVDKCYDVGRIENVHFWPFWTWDGNTAVPAFLEQNGEAFIFGRTDWEYVLNTFCFGYKIGYRFTATESGACNGNFLGIGADATQHAVVVDQCQISGLLITNGEFVSFRGTEPTEVVVADTNTGVVQFSNCAFWGPADRIAAIAGTGSVSFSQCHFVHWDRGGQGLPAISCTGGALTVASSTFTTNAPGIDIGPDVRTAVVMGNTHAGRQLVNNRNTTGDVQIGLNASGFRGITVEAGALAADDADGIPFFETEGTWHTLDMPAVQGGRARWAEKGDGAAKAHWSVEIPATGSYDVLVFHGPDPNADHAARAVYTVSHAGGTATVPVDQTTGPDRWHLLGTYPFEQGQRARVTLTNAADGNVVADAVKWVAKAPGKP